MTRRDERRHAEFTVRALPIAPADPTFLCRMIGFLCITVVGVFLAYGLGGAPTAQDDEHRARESDTDGEDF